jgi:uncharacterized tellurite resistance protein B-like protein
MDKNYQLGLLHFIHLLIGADGEVDIRELEALCKIKARENIPDTILREFEMSTKSVAERAIYQHGLDHIAQCSNDDKLRVFATLYRLSEVDGRVHAKEIRLLLYSVKMAGVEFDDVVNFAKQNPSFF